MKISTRGRYGLRAMVDLASQTPEKYVTLKSISERQGISEHYLEQLISPLKKSGFVKSARGAQGGYTINVSADDISVGDVLRVMEGSLRVVDCTDNKKESGCGASSCKSCVTKTVWEKVNNSINEVVNNIKLSDLVKDYKLLTEIEGDIYII